MKKTILITLLALLGMTQTVAQEYEYVPFVREGVKWVYFYDNTSWAPQDDLIVGKVYLTLEIKGDTIINGKSYKAMHKYYGNAINTENDTVPVYLREEDKVVYGIVPDGLASIKPDCFVGYGHMAYEDFPSIVETVWSGQEFILYDFNDPETQYKKYLDYPYEIVGEEYNDFEYLGCDSIMIGHHSAKRHKIKFLSVSSNYIIEGIGYDGQRLSGYTLAFFYVRLGPQAYFHLSHVVQNGQIIYKGLNYDPDVHVGVDEAFADKSPRLRDPNYYNLMGQPVGKEVPTAPGIYIHNGKKIIVR